MSSAASTLPLLVASLLMLLAGLSKKRLEWKPRDRSSRSELRHTSKRRRPPPDAVA